MTDCHTSTYGCPTTSTCGAAATTCVGDAGLLRARHEVVDQHAEPAVGAGRELVDDRRQVVDAAEVLDRDALDPQVVAPDLLDELGVVAPLDVDAAGQRDPGPGVGDGARARRRCGWASGAFGAPARRSTTGLPSSRKPGPSGNDLARAAAVLELDGAEVASRPA